MVYTKRKLFKKNNTTRKMKGGTGLHYLADIYATTFSTASLSNHDLAALSPFNFSSATAAAAPVTEPIAAVVGATLYEIFKAPYPDNIQIVKKRLNHFVKEQLLHILNEIGKPSRENNLDETEYLRLKYFEDFKPNVEQFFIDYLIIDKLSETFVFRDNISNILHIFPLEKLMLPIIFKVKRENDDSDSNKFDLTKDPFKTYKLGTNFNCFYDYLSTHDYSYLYFHCQELNDGNERHFVRIKLNSILMTNHQEICRYLNNEYDNIRMKIEDLARNGILEIYTINNIHVNTRHLEETNIIIRASEYENSEISMRYKLIKFAKHVALLMQNEEFVKVISEQIKEFIESYLPDLKKAHDARQQRRKAATVVQRHMKKRNIQRKKAAEEAAAAKKAAEEEAATKKAEEEGAKIIQGQVRKRMAARAEAAAKAEAANQAAGAAKQAAARAAGGEGGGNGVGGGVEGDGGEGGGEGGGGGGAGGGGGGGASMGSSSPASQRAGGGGDGGGGDGSSEYGQGGGGGGEGGDGRGSLGAAWLAQVGKR